MSGIAFGGGGVVGGAYEPIVKTLGPVFINDTVNYTTIYEYTGQGYIDLAMFLVDNTFYAVVEILIDDELMISVSVSNGSSYIAGIFASKYAFPKEANASRVFYWGTTPYTVVGTNDFTKGANINSLELGSEISFTKNIKIRAKSVSSGVNLTAKIKGGRRK